jgi:hypothetical protein
MKRAEGRAGREQRSEVRKNRNSRTAGTARRLEAAAPF